MTALCFGLSYLEFVIPLSPGVPGIKLGLANVCVTAALYLFGLPMAAGINFARMVLSWLIFGSFSGFLYSLAGGALSLAAMALIKRAGKCTPIGVSAAGGAVHNMGQLLVARLMTGTGAVVYYAPILLISGGAAGAVCGAVAFRIISRLRHSAPEKILKKR